MARVEYLLPDACVDCPLFDTCRGQENTDLVVTKKGAVNTTRRGNSECLKNFDENGIAVTETEAQTRAFVRQKPVLLHMLPPGLIGSKKRS